MKKFTEEEITLLKKHKCYVKQDTLFSAKGRLLQSKWREENEIPIGTYKSGGKAVKLGNYIEKKFAFQEQSNFLTKKIREVVNSTLLNKEKGAKIEKTRLFTNLLSSQPLAFNLFGEMVKDLTLATNLFTELFPRRVKEVTEIKFEHSPGRGNKKYTEDHSAFDVFVKYNSTKGKRGFIAIEVKYAENLKDQPSSHKKRYEEVADDSNIFIKGSFKELKKKPIQQIWRDHLLSIVTLQDYQDGFFVFLFPEQNVECQTAIKLYEQQLKSEDKFINGFYPMDLETVVGTLKKCSNAKWISDFEKRYLGK